MKSQELYNFSFNFDLKMNACLVFLISDNTCTVSNHNYVNQLYNLIVMFHL